MPKVSFIVPVSVFHSRLSACLDSLLCQGEKDIEVICANNLTDENSTKLLEKYTLFDKRIKIITAKDYSNSALRNLGIKESDSPYVVFADSFDLVSPFLAQRLYDKAAANDSDFVHCPKLCFDDDSNLFYEVDKNFYPELETVLSGGVYDETKVSADLFFNLGLAFGNKLYKKDFLVSNDLYFSDFNVFEDFEFFSRCFLKAKKISFDKLPLYFFFANFAEKESINPKNYFDAFRVLIETDKNFKESGAFDKYKTKLLLFHLRTLLFSLENIQESRKKEFFEKIKNKYTDVRIEELNLNELQAAQEFRLFAVILHKTYEEYLEIKKTGHGQ